MLYFPGAGVGADFTLYLSLSVFENRNMRFPSVPLESYFPGPGVLPAALTTWASREE